MGTKVFKTSPKVRFSVFKKMLEDKKRIQKHLHKGDSVNDLKDSKIKFAKPL